MKQVLVAVLAAALWSSIGCGESGAVDPSYDANPPADAASASDAALGGDSAQAEDLDMQATDFGCILDGTKTNKFYIRNLLGHLDEAVAVANSATGGTYPVGTVLQLIPQEAMVKRARGWNTMTNDWEFFLNVSGTTTTISTRGAQDTTNSFGGNCFDCHSKAAPQWDLVCESTHGCDPLQISDQIITNLQNSDSRCN